MRKSIFRALYLPLLLFGTIACFTACEDDTADLQPSEEAALTGEALISLRTDTTTYGLHADGALGRRGCYDLVFPVSLDLPETGIKEVADRDELKATLRAWITDHPEATERPRFVFPLTLTDADGEVLTVDNRRELIRLRLACRAELGPDHPRHPRPEAGSCFTLNYPVTVVFPSGRTTEAEDRRALKGIARRWRRANPDVPGRPRLEFPLEVTLADGSTATAETRRDLRELRRSCREEG